LAGFAGCTGNTSSPDSPQSDSSVPDDASTGHAVGDGDTGDGDGGGTGDGDTGDGDAGDGDSSDGGVDKPPTGYVTDGVITPSGQSKEDLQSAATAFYNQWKSAYVVAGCNDGEFRVKSEPDTDDFTVSEAHGYGMLFTVMMASKDSDAQKVFDGMYAYYATHQSSITDGLMAWAQDESCGNVDGDNAATDGDLDIAYALLVADATWGSGGTINYKQEALRTIAAILQGEVSDTNFLYVGDWIGSGDHDDGTRPSDFLPDHFKAFKRASGEARWTDVLDKVYSIVSEIQGNQAKNSGLLPDFVINAGTASPEPASGKWLETSHDGDYSYNACRVPWRIATDYLLSGDEHARTAIRKINAFIRSSTGDDPGQIVDGYQLDGSVFGKNNELSFYAPFMVAAMIEPESGTNQPWLDALWQQVSTVDMQNYYGDSIKLATMIVVSGMWRSP
jgi:endo-1,4-beta-D-glucanase Y